MLYRDSYDSGRKERFQLPHDDLLVSVPASENFGRHGDDQQRVGSLCRFVVYSKRKDSSVGKFPTQEIIR
jgi:hypothetical protein